jgi:hypothetical protein
MNALIAGFVAAAALILFGIFFMRVRRLERDVDYSGLRQGHEENRLALMARVVANVIVSAP